MNIRYRPEIDGLRAMAVLAVVFYHADIHINGMAYFKGGFVGVDVFFVISGYLITSIILKALSVNAFSFCDFYERRARRILPALLTVTLATIPLAWQHMLPKALKEFSGSVIAGLSFWANIWFWREDSYNAEVSAFKPFLHTWSLSVEEQFYILFPILLFLLWKYCKHAIALTLVILFTVSLLLAHWASAAYTDANFFLLPTRVWELLAGALLAKYEHAYGPHFTKPQTSMLPVIGLVLLLFSFFMFHDSMRHPSLFTLLPIVGVMLLIRFCTNQSIVTRCLSVSPLVFIGLISYSLYLWHYPVFAFSRIRWVELSLSMKVALIMLSIILAIITYFVIERPCRNKQYFEFKTFSRVVAPCFAMLIAVFGFFNYSQGAVGRAARLPDTYKHYFERVEYHGASHEIPGRHLLTNARKQSCYMRNPHDACIFGDGRIVTLGDSMIGSFENPLLTLKPWVKQGLIAMTYGACPLSDSLWYGKHAECVEVNKLRKEKILSFTDKKIFILATNQNLFQKPKLATRNPLADGRRIFDGGEFVDSDCAYSEYKKFIEFLLRQGHVVIHLQSIPLYKTKALEQDFLRWVTHLGKNTKNIDFPIWFDPRDRVYSKWEKHAAAMKLPEHPNLVQIPAHRLFCKKRNNYRCQMSDKLGPYAASGHLSYRGAQIILEEVAQELKKRQVSGFIVSDNFVG